MNLLLVFDHRFVRAADGVVSSSKSYGYSFFAKRYLQVFDSVTILARVAPDASGAHAGEATQGRGVVLASLGDWQGPLGLARVGHRVRTELGRRLSSADAVLLVAPGMLAALAHRILMRLGKPYGVEVVGDPYDAMAPASMKHPLRPVLRWSATRELRRVCADAAAVSYVTREALQRRYPCPAYAAGVSDVELSAAAFADGARAVRPQGARRTLVTVGTMAQLYKAQDVLIDAVAACVRDGVDVGLILVGDGRYRAALERRAAGRQLGERVRFVGAVPAGDAVRRVLDAADLFVLASHQEGLPRAMVEAMARALPCIGSTVGGIPELLPAEDLVPPGDAAALAARIRDVVGDPARMRRMSERSLETARRYRDDLLHEQRVAFYAHLRSATEARARRVA